MPKGPDWPARLDVRALLKDGWRPTPFREFVVKIHSRCNLACSYCYMYEMADQSWRTQPRRMADATIDAVARRIAEHVESNGLSRIELILHGGEPLLAGPASLRHAVTAVRKAVGGGVTVGASLQTNGILLDSEFLELFAELGVRVSVSLDGDEEGHDRHRRAPNGSGSHRRVVTGLERLLEPRYRHLFAGFLSTIDLRNDPVTTYEALLDFGPPSLDFLLPHGTWDSPPPRAVAAASTASSDAPYGDWLVRVFDRWYKAPESETRVRLFNEIIRMVFGRPSRMESVGLSPFAAAVIETNGAIEQVDTLKAAYEGAPRTPLHVSRDSLDEALMLPSFAARQIGLRALSDECLDCDLVRICGGGLYPHRYRAGSGFANPSVYCRDLFRLISHIATTVRRDFSDLRKSGRQRIEIKGSDERNRVINPSRHTVPEKVFLEMAVGGGGAEAVGALQAAQRSKRLLLLRGARDHAMRIDPDRAGPVREAYRLIAAVQRADPGAARAVLDYPTVAASALRALQNLSGESPDLRACADRLGAIAAAAAIRAGFPAAVELPATAGRVVLPSLGAATVAGGDRVVVRSGPDGAAVGPVELPATLDEDGPGWTALYRLTAEHEGVPVGFALDELDPDRMPGADLASRPLTDEELARWRTRLDAAWALLVDGHRAVADEVRSLITVLTPLTAPPAGESSATSKQALGNVGVSTPRDVQGLAVTLAHEVQHVKLTALIDLVPLTLPDDGGRYYAPWREDPRPLAGLLQGAYAHLGVVAFWRRERATGNAGAAGRADVEFARWRTATAQAISTLLESGRLTDAGEAFVTVMGRTLEAWCAEPVPADAEERAAAAADRHLARWRERPDGETVTVR
ncbi:uncharacterized protein BZB76_3855 [Actinomadura pelletieri DSM 43383]|uniref:Radical SAM core domain-containing protein n=1 Tax=Actinomadura pelletieri DSM 43383 TaxID=1120940 RepID=A0A495QL66_9ACTN|nr:FxsB family cyclophane-forming radical SAM/SPASM peptide maturase [Actinomadura pelletieri]RKS73171.1 uncharacterized protein BZB76_3855 [Actinomadura pelletieri DSM 43383]